MSDKKEKTINIQLSAEELAALVNTLSIAKHLFQNSATQSLNKGDQKTCDQLKSRVDICNIFIDRFIKNINIGEPLNNIHH